MLWAGRRHQAVITVPGVPAAEWNADDEHTVASYSGTEPYPADAPIAVVVFPDELDEHGLIVDEPPLKLAELASQGVSDFAFPTPRLQIFGDGDGANVTHLPPAALNHSPYHNRALDTADNADFIAAVRTGDCGAAHGTRDARRARHSSTATSGHGWPVTACSLPTIGLDHVEDDRETSSSTARHHWSYSL